MQASSMCTVASGEEPPHIFDLERNERCDVRPASTSATVLGASTIRAPRVANASACSTIASSREEAHRTNCVYARWASADNCAVAGKLLGSTNCGRIELPTFRAWAPVDLV